MSLKKGLKISDEQHSIWIIILMDLKGKDFGYEIKGNSLRPLYIFGAGILHWLPGKRNIRNIRRKSFYAKREPA
ncbi:MAG: hypothetical protein BWY13_00252 [Euryarchaeota archaeon ADurb.Bin190]|nr:MAG: hypothetical protein BWY13_00252 [Euryarchaeota archaeon ADurb.Bin190]